MEGTRREANDLLAQRIKEVNRGEYQARQDYKTFDELVEAYFRAHVQVNVRATTLRDYQNRRNRHLLPYFTGVKIRAITREMIEAFISNALEKKDTKGGKSDGRRRINKCLTLLSNMFKFAVEHRWMSHNPASSVKKLKENTGPRNEDLVEDNILQPEEIRRLLAVFDPSKERWRMIVLTAALTGLRQGELLGLQWGDIDWSRKQIYVRRQFVEGKFYDPKTKYSKRKVDIPEILISALKKWRLQCPPGEYDLVFPNGAGNPENHRNLLSREFYPALRRARLRKIRFHDLRHTFASLLIANGEHPKYIQTQLGHSSIKITMDVYGHLMHESHPEATDKLSQLVFGGSKMVANSKFGGIFGDIGNTQEISNPLKLQGESLVGSRRIELRTRGFSGLCSTD